MRDRLTRRERVGAVVFVVALAWAAGPLGGVADAGPLPLTHVVCGQAITTSIRLGNNLVSCPDGGIRIAADNVIVDLGGHSITGDGDAGDIGIEVGFAQSGVVIRNGVVKHFGYGVRFDADVDSSVSRLVVRSCPTGVWVNQSARVAVSDNVIAVGTDGVLVDAGSSDVTVSRNTLVSNSGHGINFTEMNTNTASANTIEANGVGINVEFSIDGSLSRNVIVGNTTGIRMDRANRETVTNNTILDNGTGVVLMGPGHDILARGNTISANGLEGIKTIGSSGGYRFESNVVTANHEGMAISFGGATVLSNNVSENEHDGIFRDANGVAGDTSKNIVRTNGYENGVADGAGLGIEVPITATGSGNKASANDNGAQCLPTSLCSSTAAPPPTLRTCGQTISTSIVLRNNISCNGDALTVGADNITIDLNNHRITGNAVGTAIFNNGHKNVRVIRGVIARFTFGVLLEGVAGNSVSGVIFDSDAEAVRLSGASTRTTVGGNTFIKGNHAITDEGGSHNTITRNTVIGANLGGITLDTAPTFDTVSSNLVIDPQTDSVTSGISLSGATRTSVVGNRVIATAGVGIDVNSASNSATVSRNTVMASETNGIQVSASSDVVLSKDVVTGNDSDGVSLSVTTNALVSRTFSGANSGDGLFDTNGNGDRMISNVMDENDANGISATDPSLTISKNTVNDNGFGGGVGDLSGRGIVAAAGTAGSGNHASGNDNPVQCLPAALCT